MEVGGFHNQCPPLPVKKTSFSTKLFVPVDSSLIYFSIQSFRVFGILFLMISSCIKEPALPYSREEGAELWVHLALSHPLLGGLWPLLVCL